MRTGCLHASGSDACLCVSLRSLRVTKDIQCEACAVLVFRVSNKVSVQVHPKEWRTDGVPARDRVGIRVSIWSPCGTMPSVL